MGINTQELLYLQALDSYPFDIQECLEKLQYALGAGEDHAGVHYLLGRIYDEQAQDYPTARYHYETALSINHLFTPTYAYFVNLLIIMEDYEEASRVIDIGLKISGVDKATLYFLNGILFEKYEMFSTAIKLFKKAKMSGLNSHFYNEIDEEIKRVKNKRKKSKPKKTTKKVK